MIAISVTTAKLIAAFKKEILGVFKDAKDEVNHLLDDGVAKYVDSQKEKFEHTKTFLFGNENVKFYDSYFPVGLREARKSIDIKTGDEILNIFKETNFITIIGVAGSGKTMLLKHAFLKSIDIGFKIPIIIELRDFNNSTISFSDYIKSKIFNNMLSPNEKILERLFQEGAFLFLLDGFDELFSTSIQKVVKEIDDFIDRFPKNNYLLSSRPGTGAEALPRFKNLFVQPLSDIQVKHFVVQQTSIIDDDDLGNLILNTIQKPENLSFKTYLNSPLLLSMFILTYRAYPELPKLKSKFYWNVYDTLVTKHDSLTKKGGYQHERKSGLKNDELEEILKWLGYISLFEGEYSFDKQYFVSKLNQIKEKLEKEFDNEKIIYDFTVSVSIIIIDGLDYKFPHKTLQEYFAAALIQEQNIIAKQKIYQEKFLKLSSYTTGGEEGFFNLCAETDKVCFYTYFILYNLKLFHNQLKSKDRNEKAKFIFSGCHFIESFVFDKKINKIIRFSSNTMTVTLISRILAYIGNNFYHEKLFEIRSIITPEFEEMLFDLLGKGFLKEKEVPNKEHPSKPTYEIVISYSFLPEDALYKLAESKNLNSEIMQLETFIENKIIQLETELKNDANNKMSLLDV